MFSDNGKNRPKSGSLRFLNEIILTLPVFVKIFPKIYIISRLHLSVLQGQKRPLFRYFFSLRIHLRLFSVQSAEKKAPSAADPSSNSDGACSHFIRFFPACKSKRIFVIRFANSYFAA